MRNTKRRKMKKRLIFILFIWIGIGSVFAQHPSMPLIVPPSPNASSLGVYADIPISKYTGVPNINIPLYSINVNGFTLPISLSYYASGIKVAQEASSVGLGWSLNAGGVITREIRRVDDLSSNGFPYSPKVPEQGENIDAYVDALGGYSYYHLTELDTEPDIFSFNFTGYTGKFMFTQNGDIELLKPESALKIAYVEGGFEITTLYGIMFKFKDTENTRAITYSTEYRKLYETGSGWSQPDYLVPPGLQYVSSWYLSEISLPSGENISFDYLSSASITQTRVNHYISSGQSEVRSHTYSENLKELYLNKISWSSGYIDFSTSTREDILPFVSSTPLKIDGLSLFDSNDKPIKSYVLDYSYFNEGKIDASQKYEYWRLKLNSVTELSNSGQEKPPYVFGYETINGYEYDLPSKKSSSSDFWGYFNGQENTDEYGYPMYVPEYEQVNNNLTYLYFSGADKKCYPEYLKAGILNQIKNPTGGLTQFEYEANSYENYDAYNYQYTESIVQGKACNYEFCNYWGDEGEFQTTDVQEFYIDDNIFSKKRVFISAFSENFVSSFPEPFGSYGKLSKITGENGTVVEEIVNFGYGGEWSSEVTIVPPCSGCYSIDETRFYLPSGWYRLTLTPDTMLYAEATITMHDRTEDRERQGAGLRIVKIINDAKERNFDYRFSDGRISGKLLYKPIHSYWFNALTTPFINVEYAFVNWFVNVGISMPLWPTTIRDDDGNVLPFGELLRYTNNTANFTGGSSGSTVGYSEVTEYVSDQAGNISSIRSNFLNESTAPISPFIPIKPKWSNGLSESERYFGNSKIAKQTTTAYELDQNTQQNVRALAFNDVYFYFYDIQTEWGKLISTSTSLNYDSDGLNPVTSTSNYFFDNSAHFQLTRTETMDSQGSTLISKTYYPDDYNDIAGIIKLKENHIIGVPIKKEKIVNGNLVKGQAITYNDEGQPLHIYNYEKDGLYPPQAHNPNVIVPGDYNNVLNYMYSNNLLVQLWKPNNINVSYLWGYNNTLPVIKAENVDNATLNSAISSVQSGFQEFLTNTIADLTTTPQKSAWKNFNTALRSNESLKNAMITTYTYKPLVGIKTITDPNGKTTYYEYDSFGRLKFIKDHEGNLLKKMEYNYKN